MGVKEVARRRWIRAALKVILVLKKAQPPVLETPTQKESKENCISSFLRRTLSFCLSTSLHFLTEKLSNRVPSRATSPETKPSETHLATHRNGRIKLDCRKKIEKKNQPPQCEKEKKPTRAQSLVSSEALCVREQSSASCGSSQSAD